MKDSRPMQRIGACWSDCMTMQAPIHTVAADAGPIPSGAPVSCQVMSRCRRRLIMWDGNCELPGVAVATVWLAGSYSF